MPKSVPIENKNFSNPPVLSTEASSTATSMTTTMPIADVSQSQTNLLPETVAITEPTTTRSAVVVPLMSISSTSAKAETPISAAAVAKKNRANRVNANATVSRKQPTSQIANLFHQPLSALTYLLKFNQSFLERAVLKVLDGDRTGISEEQLIAIEKIIDILVKKIMDAEPVVSTGNTALEKISGYVDKVKRSLDTSDIDSGVLSIISANLDREEQEIERLRSAYAQYTPPQHVFHDYPLPSINACAENCLRLLNSRYWFERSLYRNTDQIDLLEALEMGQLRVARFDLAATSGIQIEGDPTPEDLLRIQHVFAPPHQMGVVHDVTWYCGSTEQGMRDFFARLDPQRTYLLRTSLGSGDADYGRNGHWQILRNANGRWIGREKADEPVIFTDADASLTKATQALIGIPTEWGPTGRSLDVAEMTIERQHFLAEYISQYRYLTSTREKNRNEPTKAATRWAQFDAAQRAAAPRYLIELESDPIIYTHAKELQTFVGSERKKQFVPVQEFSSYQDNWDYLASPVFDTSADESLMVLNHMYGFDSINQAEHYANICQWVHLFKEPQPSFGFAEALNIAVKKGFTLPLAQARETHFFRNGETSEGIQLWLDGLDRALPYLITQPAIQGYPPQNMLLFFHQNKWWVFNNSYQNADGSFKPETFSITSPGQTLPSGCYFCGQLNEDGMNVLSSNDVWDNPTTGVEGYSIEYIPVDASRLRFMLEFIQQVRLIGYDLAVAELNDLNSIQWNAFKERVEGLRPQARRRLSFLPIRKLFSS